MPCALFEKNRLLRDLNVFHAVFFFSTPPPVLEIFKSPANNHVSGFPNSFSNMNDVLLSASIPYHSIIKSAIAKHYAVSKVSNATHISTRPRGKLKVKSLDAMESARLKSNSVYKH